MTQQVVGGPGGEGHLGHQARVDPAGAALVGARDGGEGRVALDLGEALGELAAGSETEAGVLIQAVALASPAYQINNCTADRAPG